MTEFDDNGLKGLAISTHTLRGERDSATSKNNFNSTQFQLTRSVGSVTRRLVYQPIRHKFQLTRSVGSVTKMIKTVSALSLISTHTLRGERDTEAKEAREAEKHFNSHAPWGA